MVSWMTLMPRARQYVSWKVVTSDARAQRDIGEGRCLQPRNGAKHDPNWRRSRRDLRGAYPFRAFLVKQNLVARFKRFAKHFGGRWFGDQRVLKRFVKPWN